MTRRVRYLGRHNEMLHEDPVEWRYSSWGTIYRALLDDFGTDDYHLGEFSAGFEQDADTVTLRFVSGRTETADLVVFADGITSTARTGSSRTRAASTPGMSAGAAPCPRTR
ncbi:hypothetical protein E1265_17530 [Streptomyces sp. 8K308]|uniref:hypothetical protein n=1 Tax=Streptomyces sp. 8K308 TaxID=2530388 RepID=UPI0010516DA6|nr:hypothetical protein [Streptomyces sp. 8K308]TDC21634.1 hypothetical protein E1265_17530 [Streptomyces sp. 8K308]